MDVNVPTPPRSDPREMYIDLVKRAVANFLYLGKDRRFEQFDCSDHYDKVSGEWRIDPVCRPISVLSKEQLDLVEHAVLTVERGGVPGDFIEAGIWRGGVVVLLRALIAAHGIADRTVFAADSFNGIPLNTHFRHDPVDRWTDRWVAGLEEVRQNIARFGLLDDRIRFVPGWFEDTLAGLAGERFALIRLDSDSYDSVRTSLDHLYPRLSQGGIVIIDDWHLVGCRFAVNDYRAAHGIDDEIHARGDNGYWVKRQEYLSPMPTVEQDDVLSSVQPD